MILVDTSVWIDHLKQGDAELMLALEEAKVLCHPMVSGELALGSLKNRRSVLDLLDGLPKAIGALHDEVMQLVEAHRLYGIGLALVDAHLLASTLLTPGAKLWSRDKRLMRVAKMLGISVDA